MKNTLILTAFAALVLVGCGRKGDPAIPSSAEPLATPPAATQEDQPTG